MMETDADRRASMLDAPNQVTAELASGGTVVGILARPYDQTLEVNGRRTTVRILKVDGDDLAVGQTLAIDNTTYTIREIETGLLLMSLVLER